MFTLAVLAILVATTSALTTVVVMRSYLLDQLSQEVEDSAARPFEGLTRPEGVSLGFDGPRQSAGSLIATDIFGSLQGFVLTTREEPVALSSSALSALAEVEHDGQSQVIDLPGLGQYVVAANRGAKGVTRVNGLSVAPVSQAVGTLVLVELGVVIIGGALTILAGVVLFRRHLRPLREVAATARYVLQLPSASGSVVLPEHVPSRLADEQDEVGQVGAALNVMLGYIENSLAASHASEERMRLFLSDVSHELRTPLATIAGYTQLAERAPDMGSLALQKIAVESQRMNALVEDLLLLARLDAEQTPNIQLVDLSFLLLEAVSDARKMAPDHEWYLELPSEALEVRADERLLHRVVANLLSNSRRHTPAGTTVAVSADSSGFTVRDDGPGFDPDVADRAFDRFVRGDPSRVREGERGTGLGLALVRSIAGAHGWEVTLTSRPSGTTIRVGFRSSTGASVDVP